MTATKQVNVKMAIKEAAADLKGPKRKGVHDG